MWHDMPSNTFERQLFFHRENSPVTQSTPEPSLLSWPGKDDHAKKIPLHPWPCCQTQSYRAYPATQTPLFSNHLMWPFDTQVCHEPQICLRYWKWFQKWLFSANSAQVWKLNRISMTIINKVARKCIRCCQNVQRCVTAPQKGEEGGGGGLCSGAWKGGQDTHVGMFSLCVADELIPSASIFTSGRQMTIPVERQSQDCIRQLGIPSCRGSNLEIGTIPRSRSTADRCMEPLNCHPRGSSCYYKFVVVSVLSGVTCLALFSNLLDSTKFSSESISLSTVPHIFVFFFPDWFKSLRAVTLLLLTYIIPLIIEAEHRAHYRRRLLPWEVLELPS